MSHEVQVKNKKFVITGSVYSTLADPLDSSLTRKIRDKP